MKRSRRRVETSVVEPLIVASWRSSCNVQPSFRSHAGLLWSSDRKFPRADNDQGRNLPDPFCPKLYDYESDTICKINFLLVASAIWIDS